MTMKAILRLLGESRERLEGDWRQDPTSGELAMALTVRDFMNDYGIQDPDDGLKQYIAFKCSQSQSLGHASVPSIPFS